MGGHSRGDRALRQLRIALGSRYGVRMRRGVFSMVGWLFAVEFVSGVIQGYYTPNFPDLVPYLGLAKDADTNWFEGAQLLLSAIAVPVFAKLGDRYGHKRMLLITTALTAAAGWWLAFTHDFTSFLVAWALMGFYVAWLPLEVALIFDRGRRSEAAVSTTRRAAGLLVVALEAGAIIGAVTGPQVLEGAGSIPVMLAVPAICTTLVFVAILLGVRESEPTAGRRLDTLGLVLITLVLLLVTGALAFLRMSGPGAWWVWLVLAAGLLLLVPFAIWERRRADPAIDLRVLGRPTMWPIQLTSGLFGICVLGAQLPLINYVATEPATYGFGLGLHGFSRSLIIGIYLIAMIVGAILLPSLSRWTTPRVALIIAAFLVAAGYLLLLPLHSAFAEVTVDMIIAGLGSGALVAALPASAAAAAPRGQTGVATGLTNMTKTIGGAIASAAFALVLFHGGAETEGTASSLGAYLVVWSICGGAALVSALLLFVVPKAAFSDRPAEEAVAALD